MLVPAVLAASVSPARKLPVIDTVAPISWEASRLTKVRPPSSGTGAPPALKVEWAPEGMSTGGSLTVTALVAASEMAPPLSVTCQLRVRVRSLPPAVMSAPLVEKLIELSAAW